MQAEATNLIATPPGRSYYDPAVFQQEVERVFGQHWVCVERADQINNVGDFITVNIGNENIIVVRGKDKGVRAFYNVCRHRGAQVCTKTSGTAKAFQCMYHAWTYNLEGKLQGAPNISSFGSFDRSEYGLIPVAVQVWQGLVWLNLSDDPEPLSEQTHPPLVERFGDLVPFERYGIGDLVLGKRLTYDVNANWKIIVENFMECYHCAPMHPELCERLPGFYNGVSMQSIVGTGTQFADDIDVFSMSGKGERANLPGLTEAEDRQYYGLIIAPNVLISLLPDHVIIHMAHPRGPDQTYVTCDWLFAPEVVADPTFDPSDTVEIFDIVNKQDWVVCELQHRGMRSKAFNNGGIYVPSEHHIAGFNAQIRDWLSTPPA